MKMRWRTASSTTEQEKQKQTQNQPQQQQQDQQQQQQATPKDIIQSNSSSDGIDDDEQDYPHSHPHSPHTHNSPHSPHTSATGGAVGDGPHLTHMDMSDMDMAMGVGVGMGMGMNMGVGALGIGSMGMDMDMNMDHMDMDHMDHMDMDMAAMRGISPSINTMSSMSRQVNEFEELVGDLAHRDASASVSASASASAAGRSRSSLSASSAHSQIQSQSASSSSAASSLVSSLPPTDGDSSFPSGLSSLAAAESSSNAASPIKTSQSSASGGGGSISASASAIAIASGANGDSSSSSASDALSTKTKTNQEQNTSLSDVEEEDDDEDEDDYEEDEDDDEDDDDDPGQDHAIPDDGPDSATEWSAQSEQSTCEFTHTIKNYSSKRESGCKKAEYSSTTVDSCGNRWRLIVYVNGNGRASNHHLSLFLQVADADELPFGWKKAVSYVLTLEHPSGPTLGYAKRNPDKTFKLCPKAIDWGWSQFITSDRIQQEGYISNDSLTVRASVTVKSSSISIDPEDAELYLKCAVEEGNAEAVELCLAQGASVNCQFKDDLYTPLHTACSSSTSNGSLDVLKLLLKRGADGNACNKWRETPLLIAANNGHKAAVEALLKSGANPSLCSEAGWSALTFAAHKGYDDIVTLLLKAGAPVNCRVIEDLSTPLHKACAGNKSGHLSAVKQLLKGGADVHALNKWRETPLLTAANHGQAAAVEALLDDGGDPCKCTDTGWSPLSIAAYKGHDEVVRLLLEQGAPTEEADPTLSALLQAATKGLPDTVELLLRHGADHSVTTKKGDTALSILVEQNLIDAAVEMVTEYKASVPRCSRDRKKVQRARLLINLRVKKQKGMLNYESDDGDSDHDDSDIGSRSALHDSDGSSNSPPPTAATKKKKKKKRAKDRESAEAEAKAAEEALLLELAQEDAKAQKDEAAANSKRNKKKKRKERERQKALEEERLKKEKEEKEAAEKERKRLLKEEKQRKEQKEKARLQQEAAEKEERAAAKRREKELMKLKEQEKKEREKAMRKATSTAPTQQQSNNTASSTTKDKAAPKVKAGKKVTEAKKPEAKSSTVSSKASVAATKKPRVVTNLTQPLSKPLTGNTRGWETKNVNAPPAKTKAVEESAPSREPEPVAVSDFPPVQQLKENVTTTSPPPTPAKPNTDLDNQSFSNASVEDQLENMATGVVGSLGLGFDIPDPSNGLDDLSNLSVNSGTKEYSYGNSIAFEAPAVSLYRQEKVNELLQRLSLTRSSSSNNPLMAVNDHVFGNVIYKWIVRASYESTTCLDPVIPSWTDTEMLVAFFQRQFISESRQRGSLSTGINIEILKEAGAIMADLCFSFAKDISDFKNSYKDCLPQEFNDANLGLVAREMAVNGEGSNVVAIDWTERYSIFLPALTFSKLRNRYCGPSNLLLASVYGLAKRYETMRMILSDTTQDYRLPLTTLNSLARELNASLELWSDPLCALDNYNFCGIFSDVDSQFGGFEPFGKPGSNGEVALMRKGGSVVALPPLDSTTTSIYVKRMLYLLEDIEGNGTPMSFAVFLPRQCFRDLNTSPTIESLGLLDTRLLDTHRGFITTCELLHPGQHSYKKGDGTGDNICHSGSLFLLLQNDAGRMHYGVNKTSIANILNSFAAPYVSDSNPGVVYRPMPTEGGLPTSVPVSPINTHNNMSHGDTGVIGGSTLGPAFPVGKNGARKRGRLFERGRLFDDGEVEAANEQQADDVSGLLNNLDLGMFQNNPSQDVDIEAISLMGLGLGGKKW